METWGKSEHMMYHSIRKLMLVLASLLLGGVLFAADALVTLDQVKGYDIIEYVFDVDGKTKDFVLRKAIVPEDGDPIFLTEEDMVEALDSKKQLLFNKRIFTKVEYTYSLESFVRGIAQYKATYHIVDASTFLAIPYPKYDNDEMGLRLGVKIYEKNILGTFGDLTFTGHVSQGDGGRSGWENREDFLELDISALPILDTSLGLNFKYEQVQNSSETGDFDFAFDWTGLQVFGIGVGISAWGDFNPASDFSAWNPEEYGVTFTYGPFYQNGGRYTLSSTLEIEQDELTLLDHFKTNTVLSQHDLSLFTLPLSFNMQVETDKLRSNPTMDAVNVSSSIGTGFALPFGYSFSTSVRALLEFNPSLDPLPYSYTYTTTINKSAINWVENFRKGAKVSLTYSYQQYPQPEYADTWYMEGKLSWFPFILWRLNPSLELTGFVTDGNKRTFLPSDDEDIDDYFRGYLSRTLKNSYENGAIGYGAILNLNMTAEFINFGFARSYVNPFLDIGIFENPSQSNGRSILAAAGVEGWGILNKFPSYPVRGSLGFNLGDVKKALAGDIDVREIEWELSIGMGLFF